MDAQAEGTKGGNLAQMNVVPLIDILLVLLIIFMVITPLRSVGLPAAIPRPPLRPEDVTVPVETPVVVQIFSDGSLRINGEAESWEALGSRLTETFKRRNDKVAFVWGEHSVEFSRVARAIERMHDAGLDEVALLTPALVLGR